jgi:hypothetical protein
MVKKALSSVVNAVKVVEKKEENPENHVKKDAVLEKDVANFLK